MANKTLMVFPSAGGKNPSDLAGGYAHWILFQAEHSVL